MFGTFIIMAAIEGSLFIDKPHARVFAVTILAIGLVLRGLAGERAAKKKAAAEVVPEVGLSGLPASQLEGERLDPLVCAVRGAGRTLNFAIEEAKQTGRHRLYVMFIREQVVITPEDRRRTWEQDPQAREIFNYAQSHAQGMTVIPCYAVSDSPADTIVDITATLGAGRLILGAPERSALVKFLRGNIIRHVADLLPDDIYLVVCA